MGFTENCSFMWNQPEGKKKSQNQWTRKTTAKPTKSKATTKTWLKNETKRGKYQAEQNSCAANKTGGFCFHAESRFQKSKIKLYLSVSLVRMNSQILWVHGQCSLFGAETTGIPHCEKRQWVRNCAVQEQPESCLTGFPSSRFPQALMQTSGHSWAWWHLFLYF